MFKNIYQYYLYILTNKKTKNNESNDVDRNNNQQTDNRNIDSYQRSKRNGDTEDDKENSEHVMLVDLARNDLSRNGNMVKVDKYREVQFFSHVSNRSLTEEGL